jgi:hypothetical protein
VEFDKAPLLDDRSVVDPIKRSIGDGPAGAFARNVFVMYEFHVIDHENWPICVLGRYLGQREREALPASAGEMLFVRVPVVRVWSGTKYGQRLNRSRLRRDGRMVNRSAAHTNAGEGRNGPRPVASTSTSR